MKNGTQHIYLDFAAATPVRSEVLQAMEPYWQDAFANPQSVHEVGQSAKTAVDGARSKIADVLSVQSGEIVFTSGATEANSLALLGVARAARSEKRTRPAVLLSAITHGSVRNISESYAEEVQVQTCGVAADGRLDPVDIYRQITADTVLVTCSHANSEIGTIQPTRKIADVIMKWRKEHNTSYPLLHVDASQTAAYEKIQPESLGADLLTINSAKMYGPKGVGLLWVRSGTPLSPATIAPSGRQVGDYQKLRAGTPPTPLIAGFATALDWAQSNHEHHNKHARELQTYFIEELQSAFSDVQINGSLDQRIANNISFTLPEKDHDFLVAQLSAEGIMVATTSACQTDMQTGSKVLRQIGASQALRVSLGRESSHDDLNQFLKVLQRLVRN